MDVTVGQARARAGVHGGTPAFPVLLISNMGGSDGGGSTDPAVPEVDDFKYSRNEEDLCLSAWASRTVLEVHDPRPYSCWPKWSSAVVGLKMRSVLSTLVQRPQSVAGAMKVYSLIGHAFATQTERLLTMFVGPAPGLWMHLQTKDLVLKLSGAISNPVSQSTVIEVVE